MSRETEKQASSRSRMTVYRERMRRLGLRPVQIWVPDTRSADFAAACHRQSLAVAASDPGGDEIMRFISEASEWPDD